MLNFLMERVNLGRGGAALIGAQMGTPIPLPPTALQLRDDRDERAALGGRE